MAIDTLPVALQNIIQGHYLERKFLDGLNSTLGFRAIADREMIPMKLGETVTKTRAGLLIPSTTPLDPSTNLNLDNGMTPQNWGVEQYTLSMSAYGNTMDLNQVTSKVAIAELFVQNNDKLAIQARQTLDRLARNALYATYLGANTIVTTTLVSAGPIIAVDNVVGFENISSNGVLTPVSTGNPMAVAVGSSSYTLVATSYDATNVSSLAAYGGRSGTLTFATNVTIGNGTAGNPVTSSVAPSVLRAGNRTTTLGLGTGGAADLLTLGTVLSAVAQLRDNGVPDIRGLYNCYLDNKTLLELFQDPMFQNLFRGAYGSTAIKEGDLIQLMGVRFIPTTEAPQQTLNGTRIRRAIVCGQGALIEGAFEGLDTAEESPQSLSFMVDGVLLVVRPPLDRLGQIIGQSWCWMGGYCVPTDVTATSNIIPTASNAYWKRAVVIECL